MKGIANFGPFPRKDKQKNLVYSFGNMGNFENDTVSFDFNEHPVKSFITFNGVNTSNTYCGDNGIVYLKDLDYDKWNINLLGVGYGDTTFSQDSR